MNDPTCGSRPQQLLLGLTPDLSLDHPQKRAQTASDESAGLIVPGELLQPVNDKQIAFGKADCGRADVPVIRPRLQSLIVNNDETGFNNPASPVWHSKATDKPQSNDSLEDARPKELSTSVPVGQDAISPLEWLLDPQKSRQFGDLGSGSLNQTFDRILARLIQFEAHEGNPHLVEGYRIAWLIVRFCQTGEAKLCTPQVLATYRVLGCHPDQVWTRIVQRRFALNGRSTPLAIRPKAGAELTDPKLAAPVPPSQKKPATVIPIEKEKQA